MTSDSCNVPAERRPVPASEWSPRETTSSQSSATHKPESRAQHIADLSSDIDFRSSYSTPRSTQNTQQTPTSMRPSSSLRTSRARARRMEFDVCQDSQNLMVRDLEQTRYDIGRVREDMDKLTKKLQGMAADITSTKTRVSTYIQNIGNMEQTLVSTQEVNVNLQILLERAVLSQKRLDTDTMQRVRQFQGDLSKILYENEEMQSRIDSMETNQYTYDGKVADLNNQVREYASLLEQARDTIHTMADITPSIASSEEEYASSEPNTSSRRASIASSWATEDEGLGRKESEITSVMSPKLSYTTDNKDILRSRIIRTKAMNPDKESATGLKLLLSDKSFQKKP